MPHLPETVDDLTAHWFGEVLGAPVEEVVVRRVGTGQMGSCFRVSLTGAPAASGLPASVLVKLPAEDPASRDLVAGAYRGELRFYADLAPTLAIRVPRVHHAAMAAEGGSFVLVMEDLAPREQGDQIAGCTVAQAHDAVANLAGLHGPRWGDPVLPTLEGLAPSGPEDADLLADLFGPAVEIFLSGVGARLSDEDAATLRACPGVARAWALARPERWGLVHGDYRLDNLLFPPTGSPDPHGPHDPHDVVAVDWQTLSFALPARDLAYLVATSLDPAERREHERAIVATYHSALLGHGVTGYSLDDCWDDYRLAMIQGPLVSVFGFAYGARTDRGDAMFAAMVSRSCAAIRDLDTLAQPALR